VVVWLLLCSWSSYAQNTVSGVVKDANSGDPIPGVNITLKSDSRTGTVSDIDGKYSLQAGSDAVLIFSFIGYENMEVAINGRSTVDVGLALESKELTEVVVTAFGLERDKKALTYAAQNVELAGIAEARPNQNLVNGLQGKVAGLSIQTSGTGVTGASKVILRGNRSVNGSSQPLYIVDGVPLGGDISNISPDDVESISVLKGANAAALYGSRANNGVIVINTKKGSSGFNVNLNHTFTTDRAILLHEYQNEFGQGSGGTYVPNSTFTWGPRLDGSQVAHWSPDPNFPNATYAYSAHPDNVSDFFDTGRSLATNLSISTSNDKTSTYFSYTHDDRKGIVPGNELTRHNLNLRIQNKIGDKVTFNGKINFIRSEIDNELATGENFANPVRHALRLPRNISTAEASLFEYTDPSASVRQHYWVPGDNGGANPYWTINRNLNETTEDRVIGFVSVVYEPFDGLTILGRSALDRSNFFRENRLFNDSYIIADNGRYDAISDDRYEWNTDFLVTYTKDLGDFSFDANVGGNTRVENRNRLTATTGGNPGLLIPNLFALSNAAVPQASTQELFQREVNSLYAFGQIGYKNGIFLDLTFRNDWSSTLPEENRSFSYPSVGLSAVISELVTLPDVISFLKARASYAEVGNDTDPFQLARLVNVSGGFLQLNSTQPNANLKPERTRSIELGLDARFLNARLGLDFTYYRTNSEDQLFAQDVPQGSGISQRFLNGGDIQNEGVEIVLTANPIRTKDFNWDIAFNFARNVSTVVELAEGIDQLNYGADFLRSFRLDVGDMWGNIYSRGFMRDNAGNVMIQPATLDDGSANPLAGVPMITPGLDVVIGNFNPDWIGGITNSFTYKGFNANFVIDIRSGGEVVSFTEAILAADGLTANSAAGRDGSLIFGQNVYADESAVVNEAPNNVSVNAETLWTNLGGRNAPVGEAFVRSASNVRMREISLGYSLPSDLLSKTPIKTAKVSFVGRNLFFISNAAEIVDPEVVTSTGITADGFESFALPTTRSFGVNLQFGF